MKFIKILDILKENNVYYIPYSMTELVKILFVKVIETFDEEGKKVMKNVYLIPNLENLLIYKKKEITEEIWQELLSKYAEKSIDLDVLNHLDYQLNSLQKFAVIIASKINSVMKDYEKLLDLLEKDAEELTKKTSNRRSEGGILGFDMPGQKIDQEEKFKNDADYIDSKTKSENKDIVNVKDYSAAERILKEISRIKKQIVIEVANDLFITDTNDDRLGIC